MPKVVVVVVGHSGAQQRSRSPCANVHAPKNNNMMRWVVGWLAGLKGLSVGRQPGAGCKQYNITKKKSVEKRATTEHQVRGGVSPLAFLVRPDPGGEAEKNDSGWLALAMGGGLNYFPSNLPSSLVGSRSFLLLEAVNFYAWIKSAGCALCVCLYMCMLLWRQIKLHNG